MRRLGVPVAVLAAGVWWEVRVESSISVSDLNLLNCDSL